MLGNRIRTSKDNPLTSFLTNVLSGSSDIKKTASSDSSDVLEDFSGYFDESKSDAAGIAKKIAESRKNITISRNLGYEGVPDKNSQNFEDPSLRKRAESNATQKACDLVKQQAEKIGIPLLKIVRAEVQDIAYRPVGMIRKNAEVTYADVEVALEHPSIQGQTIKVSVNCSQDSASFTSGFKLQGHQFPLNREGWNRLVRFYKTASRGSKPVKLVVRQFTKDYPEGYYEALGYYPDPAALEAMLKTNNVIYNYIDPTTIEPVIFDEADASKVLKIAEALNKYNTSLASSVEDGGTAALSVDEEEDADKAIEEVVKSNKKGDYTLDVDRNPGGGATVTVTKKNAQSYARSLNREEELEDVDDYEPLDDYGNPLSSDISTGYDYLETNFPHLVPLRDAFQPEAFEELIGFVEDEVVSYSDRDYSWQEVELAVLRALESILDENQLEAINRGELRGAFGREAVSYLTGSDPDNDYSRRFTDSVRETLPGASEEVRSLYTQDTVLTEAENRYPRTPTRPIEPQDFDEEERDWVSDVPEPPAYREYLDRPQMDIRQPTVNLPEEDEEEEDALVGIGPAADTGGYSGPRPPRIWRYASRPSKTASKGSPVSEGEPPAATRNAGPSASKLQFKGPAGTQKQMKNSPSYRSDVSRPRTRENPEQPVYKNPATSMEPPTKNRGPAATKLKMRGPGGEQKTWANETPRKVGLPTGEGTVDEFMSREIPEESKGNVNSFFEGKGRSGRGGKAMSLEMGRYKGNPSATSGPEFFRKQSSLNKAFPYPFR